MKFEHIPVLLEEVLYYMDIKPDGVYVDGTLGGGGHSLEIASRLEKNGRLICIDQDREAIEEGSKKLEAYKDRVTIVKSNYSEIPIIVKDLGVGKVDGILLDIGVSSYQFDNPERGFSYREEAPLDMRMDQNLGLTAQDVVNDYSEEELREILKKYGEEEYAYNIAKEIVKTREEKRIETTFDLNDVVKRAIPARARDRKGHPSKQTFQALRIEVNKELEVLENSIDGMIDSLGDGGRLCIITFHSLEDRIVKEAFKRNQNPCICPPNFPKCVCGKVSKGRVLTRKPVIAGTYELERNRRSKSAKLRVFERISEEEKIFDEG